MTVLFEGQPVLPNTDQGPIGDCWVVSVINALAFVPSGPAFIANDIVQTASGFTVTLYKAASGGLPGIGTQNYQPVQISVPNSFPYYAANGGAGGYGGVLEAAVASLNGGYSVIGGGGDPAVAMEELTGHPATAQIPSTIAFAALLADFKAGDLITLDSFPMAGLPYGLVKNHAYTLVGITSTTAATATLQLLNPWGYDNPSQIPFVGMQKNGIEEIDIGRV